MKKMEAAIVYWGYIGMMEDNMEATRVIEGFGNGVYIGDIQCKHCEGIAAGQVAAHPCSWAAHT